jgi:hypothetical protein
MPFIAPVISGYTDHRISCRVARRQFGYCREITTPEGVCTPPTIAWRGTSPAPRLGGTVRFSWYRPAPDNPANVGVTLAPLIRIVTALLVGAAPE